MKDAPGKLYAVQGDITKEEDILGVFKWINEKLGGVDVLVNNAGVGFDVDLTGTFCFLKARIYIY